MPDTPPIVRNAFFRLDAEGVRLTPIQLLDMIIKVKTESGQLPGVTLVAASDQASAMSRLLSPASRPTATIWWEGIGSQAAQFYGVYNWLFNVDIQVADMPLAMKTASAGQGVFSPKLQQAIVETEQFLRSIQFTASNIAKIGFEIIKSNWIVDEESLALLGHRITLSLPVAAPQVQSILQINPAAMLTESSNTNRK